MPLVQLVERRFPKPNVVGSSPTGHVFFEETLILYLYTEKNYKKHCLNKI